MHNVVGTRAIRTRLAREPNLEHTGSAISRVRRRGGPENVHGLALGLAGVVDGDGAFVLSVLAVSQILPTLRSFFFLDDAACTCMLYERLTLSEYCAWMHLHPAVNGATVPATWNHFPRYDSSWNPMSALG